jgi:polar amino acid transport system permease protein
MAMGVGGPGLAGRTSTEDAFRLARPEVIVAEIAASRARAGVRFRVIFLLTWLVLVGGLVIALAQSGKVDPTFIGKWGPFIIQGIPVTIFVSLCSIVLAVAFALFGALGRLSRNPPIYAVATLYVSMVRGTPLIVQIIFIYLALPQFGIVLDPLPSGILALSFNYGAYLTEIFRAGVEAIPRGQREAAQALGMQERSIMRRVILPQAIRIVTPAIGNDFISMTKDSALVSYVTIQEVFWRANNAGTQTFRNFEALMIAAAVYWAMTIVFSLAQERLEKRLAESDVRV